MSKKNKQKFEFCVGTSNSFRSTLWKIVVNKSDIYILPQSSKNYFKISLHGSGVCQMAITGEHLQELNIPTEERGVRWKCDVEEFNAQIVFTINFLNFFLFDYSEKEEIDSNITFVPPPKDGKHTEILFYKVKAKLPVEGVLPKGYHLLCYFELNNGELLTVLYHYPDFTEEKKETFIEAYKKILWKIENNKNLQSEDPIPGYLFTDNFKYIEIFI